MVLGVHLCDPSLPTPPVCKAADAHKQPSLSTQLSTYLTISTRPREDDRQKPLHISCAICSSNSPKRKLRHRSYGFAPGPTHMLLSSHESAPGLLLSDYLSTSLRTVAGLLGTEF
ncbi:hypothetical protein WR25_13894 [Diploscapter pachys]|uniref:Uncharacterized protein n=1 Tax=Diploscapter pachys TaxID=2018661 RepID=A0A2A2LHS7_9BILA|nr:hypothetical protein WR25_13894 [Diploscapter pachys]